ncbi:hypothetical protein HMPREF0868_1064 [Mageeibacillus indolicus UPII9-5]|uniref:Uncharacterized protein n=1 Tax=Mageeibacillus indolicus (strain UPII9-5) TaxID=699246 RepID=D3R2F0_MAGIU|nr:hypothetical protein HMPREF0868_1064 [Mageeibacillus indolicus UPII9-5]
MIIYWSILVLITIFFLFKNMDKLENYRNEMIRMIDNEICEILIENNVGYQKKKKKKKKKY